MADSPQSPAVAITDHATARRFADAFRQQGKLAEAIACYRRALALKPDDAGSFNDLGVSLTDVGQTAEGIACYQAALRLAPRMAQAHSNLGVAYRDLGRFEEAVACHRAALALRPDLAPIHSNLGNALRDQRQFAEAIACFQRAVQLQPRFADAYRNLGNALRDAGQVEEAIGAYRQALELSPSSYEAHNDLGVALRDWGRYDEAISSLNAAVAINSDFAEAHYNLGISYLLNGDYARGWAEYHLRCRMKRFQKRVVQQPPWDGSDARRKTVLIFAEQGLGDTLHFVRYLPLVRQRVGRLVFQCQPPLRQLLAGAAGIDEFVPADQPTPEFDTYAPLLSLPHLLGIPDPHNTPAPPYLKANPELVAKWKAELERIAGFRVGICWQGNPHHPSDRARSFPLSLLAPLAGLPGVRLISLQKGFGREQIAMFSQRDALVDLGSRLDEGTGAFIETAAVIKNLDLVITADTVIAHLAGALGAPVWLLLSAVPDWRWGRSGNTTPWYPSMRLFRQSRLLQWQDVLDAVRTELVSQVS
jgi:tetratricopeptide (TPR) repeat protein